MRPSLVSLSNTSMSAQALSGSCQHFFKELLPLQQYNSWIKPLQFEVSGNRLILTVPNSFTLRIIQERFLPEISKRAATFFSFPPEIELRIEKKNPIPSLNVVNQAKTEIRNHSIEIKQPKNISKLNTQLTFETFVTGKANQLAHAAGLQVAEKPGTTYNPLFIYGGVGLGKTHLLQSIGNLVTKENPQAHICYVHATNYVSGVVKAFQTKSF